MTPNGGMKTNTASNTASDPRRAALEEWCARELRTPRPRLAVASADASARRYFRVHVGDETYIAMDAPDQHESLAAFLRVAELMQAAGVNVPRIFAQDLERGYLLLTDMGRETYLDVLPGRDPRGLFDAATAELLRWQVATRPGALPEFSAELLRTELELFPVWYLERHRGITLAVVRRREVERIFDAIVERVGSQPRVFVHRDYMPRNLLVGDPAPGVIDFQDAVLGPVTYDAVSLYRDAFISWPESFVTEGLRRYWTEAQKADLPVPPSFGDFLTECRWMGVQRHLKVLGIFARLHYRDNKPGYLADAPRFIGYLREAVAADPELAETLAPLFPWLDKEEG